MKNFSGVYTAICFNMHSTSNAFFNGNCLCPVFQSPTMDTYCAVEFLCGVNGILKIDIFIICNEPHCFLQKSDIV